MKFVLVVLAIILAGCTPYPDTGEPNRLTDVLPIIERIIRLLAGSAAIAFFFMLIVGGFKFITSGGDPKEAAQARSILTYAIIGIVLVVLSWLILLLIETLTGVPVTNVAFPL